jgi:hypothetical protein
MQAGRMATMAQLIERTLEMWVSGVRLFLYSELVLRTVASDVRDTYGLDGKDQEKKAKNSTVSGASTDTGVLEKLCLF